MTRGEPSRPRLRELRARLLRFLSATRFRICKL